MTIKNNFTRAPEGQPNIESVCFYDTHMSQLYFEENIKILQESGYRSTCKAYYIENGNVDDDSAITFTIKGDTSEKVRFLEKQGYTGDDMPKPEDMNECIIDSYGERISLLNYDDFNSYMLKDYQLELIPSKNIKSISIRGYSQGDYAQVFYCPDDLEDSWGNTPVENDLRKEFTRLFYDAPIYAQITIDGKEYLYCEYMPDSYEWNREAWARIVSEKSGIDYDLILSFLPKYPSYN